MNIAIIGGGAAGMMAASRIVELSGNTHTVHLFEKNVRIGSKVLISGGGRCNVTTGIQDMQLLQTKYPRGARFLKHALYSFSPKDVYGWFEKQGVPLKIEKDLRVFPRSDEGKDVVHVFEKLFAKYKVQVHFKHVLKEITSQNGQFMLHFQGYPQMKVDKVIIATGGQAFRHTGSTGDGYAFAESLGHHITTLAPSLSSFVVDAPWVKEVAGVSFQRAIFSIKGEKNYEFAGPFIFTHKGVSGPAIFAMSALSAFEQYDQEHPMSLFVDMLPDVTFETLTADIFSYQKEHHKRTMVTLLKEYVPASLAEIFCNLLEIPTTCILAEVSKKNLLKAINLLKRHKFSVIGRGAGDEFVTAGGVDLSEIDPKTMESKCTPGLFFAGEVMNIDGFTGGFNLQASWATGRCAGESSVRQ